MDRRYLAGFFDGEGCVHSQGQYVRITIGQRKSEVLYEIQRYLGMGSITSNGPKGGERLTICGRENCKKFIKIVYPYSIVKKKELRVAYALIGVRNSKEKQRVLSQELKELKKIP
jgi:intein/homing endonuclease